ncbi:hypothetical protein AJ88_23575 [Mesorhizobium amorphae CCBAU 01583]|nr:hypothetical protein AJ88_23575 [Mesorhizobium amorphae CCBAU 01583]
MSDSESDYDADSESTLFSDEKDGSSSEEDDSSSEEEEEEEEGLEPPPADLHADDFSSSGFPLRRTTTRTRSDQAALAWHCCIFVF